MENRTYYITRTRCMCGENRNMIKTFFQIGFGLGLGLTTGVILISSIVGILDFIIKKLQ